MNTERFNFTRAFLVEGLLFSIFIVGLALHYAGLLTPQYEKIVLATIGAIGIIPVIKSAWKSILEKQISVDLLATIALLFSFLSGQWGSMLFINLMLTSARVLDLYTKRRARISLESLAKLKPSQARVIRDEVPSLVPIAEVIVGDLIVINLGEQVPVDAIIIKGEAALDQSSLTGESVPVSKTIGERVLSATVVVSGNIIVRTERIGEETTFERMIKLVESAQDAKTRMKTLAERFASWYIGIMLVVASGLYLITKDVNLVLAVVLVVCADDIAIAIPLAYITGIGTAARRGIIVKGADFLEGFSKITTLIVDKTGTVTMGKLVIMDVQIWGDIPELKVLELSGTICKGSTHPISKAITQYVLAKHIAISEPNNFEEKGGRGIHGVKDGFEILVGRLEFLKEQGVVPTDIELTAINVSTSHANNVTLVSINGKIAGMFGLADEMRESVPSTISALKRRGVKETVMLTGDNAIVAKAMAEHAGIDTYYADLLPENKVSILARYIKPENKVAMVGDGVNDAAVLARADIGIAMGGIGSDAAIESADIVLMKDDFSKILELRNISDSVLRVAYQNFGIWAVVNAIGLYFVFTRVLDPSGAAAYNFATDFIPIINSLRLFYYKDVK